MSPLLFESICLREGKLENLPLHQRRLEQSIEPREKPLILEEVLHACTLPQEGLHKVKLVYTAAAELVRIESVPYVKKNVPCLTLVEVPNIEYSKKYLDRSALDALCHQAQSEILITQDGFLTDTSYSNIALWNGHCWVTPVHCLLRGTKREYLLQTGALCVEPIHRDSLAEYESCCLMNAMLDIGEVIVPIAALHLSDCGVV